MEVPRGRDTEWSPEKDFPQGTLQLFPDLSKKEKDRRNSERERERETERQRDRDIEIERKCRDLTSQNLKEQSHEIFETFFISKTLLLGPIRTGKNGFAKYFVLRRYSRKFSKNECLRSCWLRWYSVSVVVDYADTMPAWSLITTTQCQRRQRLRGHAQ